MTSPQPQDWQRRFQDLKIEVDSHSERLRQQATSIPEQLNQVEVEFPRFGIEALSHSYQQFVAWFNGIPSSGKLLAIAGGGLLSLTLIKTVFQLITSLITLSIFGVVLYLIYRFWILPKSE
jgi:hypothetical protein